MQLLNSLFPMRVVTDIILVNESPESYGFGEEALKAGARLLYAPRFTDGVAQEVPGVLYKYNFKWHVNIREGTFCLKSYLKTDFKNSL